MSVLKEFNEQTTKNKLAIGIIYDLDRHRLGNKEVSDKLLLEVLLSKTHEELEELTKSTSWIHNSFKDTKFIVETMWKDGRIPELSSWRKNPGYHMSKEEQENMPYLKYSSNEEWVKEKLDQGFYISEVTEIIKEKE